MKGRVILYGLFILIITSCYQNEDNESIELEIISKKNHYNYLNFRNREKGYIFDDSKNFLNKISFSIKNNGSNTVVMPTSCMGLEVPGCTEYSFPVPFTGLSSLNLVIKDDKGEEVENKMLLGGLKYLEETNERNEELAEEYYLKLNPNKKDDWFWSKKIKENTITIHPKEVLFFESFYSLPLNRTSVFSNRVIHNLKKNREYKLSLIFKSDTTDVWKNMNNAEKETFKKNDYEFYTGKIKSKNSIPLILNKSFE